MNERDRRIIEKIAQYCERIKTNLDRYNDSYDAFCSDLLFQDACCMCILQIGELAGALSDEARQQHSSIPWRIIKDTRNVYVHAYGSIDIHTVWSTLHEDIPPLYEACRAILEN